MKNFTKKIRSKSIIVLLSLLSVFFVLSVAFTMSKSVIEKPVGNLTLNLTSVDTLIPGLQLRNTLGTSVTEVVFGKTEDYENEIAGIEPINVDVQKKGKIKLYAKGTKAYILSDFLKTDLTDFFDAWGFFQTGKFMLIRIAFTRFMSLWN